MNIKKIVKIIVVALMALLLPFGANEKNVIIFKKNYNSNNDFIYLSSIKPMTSTVGYKNIGYDKNVEGGMISLIIGGEQKYFIKGIAAHAPSTLIYDLKDYTYDKFTAYIGMDAAYQNNNADGGKFHFYVSNDGVNWIEQYASTDAQKSNMNSPFVSIDIKNYRYLKLYCNSLRNNWSDHATYANAKLIKEDYIEDNSEVNFIKKIDQYDQIIKSYPIDSNIKDYEQTLLQRTFVKNVGYEILQALAKDNDDIKEALQWLIEDEDALKLYLTGGKPDGTYMDSIKILTDLYTKHKADLKNTEIDNISGVKIGQIYKKMMISLSLTHARKIHFWQDAQQVSDPVVRYEIFKELRIKNLLEKNIFDGLPIVNMRLVFNSMISDEQIPWLNNYVRLHNNNKNPYNYIRYTGDYNYYEDQYYSDENYDKWNQKYKLSEYNIPYEKNHPKIWVIFEEGSVCGGLSKTGTNLNTSRGIPALVLGQPGHAAYMYYSQTPEGLGKWDLGNDVFGWAKSHWTYEGNVSTGWGTESWAGQHPASYTLLTQAALNDLSNFEASSELIYLSNVYKSTNDYKTLEKIYNLALDKQILNFDAWKELVNLYKLDDTKTEQDYLNLSSRIIDSLTYYPFPMHYLTKQLDSKITSDKGILYLSVLKDKALKKAMKATTQDTVQPNESKKLAQFLLGEENFNIATFSFDGDNANKITLSSKFSESTTKLKYSLDGGTIYTETDSKEVLLTQPEIDSIDPNKDIIVGLVGSDDVQTIDINSFSAPTKLYNNDLENKVIGATNEMEWSFNLIDWVSFSEANPNLLGNKSIYVRITAKKTTKASLPILLTYTEDIDDLSQTYIPINHLSISDFSTNQSGSDAKNIIDGNINTMWHTLWDGSDKRKFLTIKLDKASYISALEYMPRIDGTNGTIRSGDVLVSMDGTNWKTIGKFSGWKYDYTAKKIVFKTPMLANYVKLIATETSGSYASGTMINLFEDNRNIPLASISNDEGTFDLYDKSLNHKNLSFEVEKNSENISYISVNDHEYSLMDEEDEKALENILTIENINNGYKINLLTSWLNKLDNGIYTLVLTTDRNNKLNYNINIVDTLIKTNNFVDLNGLGNIQLKENIDSNYQLKIENLEKNNLEKFSDQLNNKTIIANYDIALYHNENKLNYEKELLITLNLGKQNASKKVSVLFEKNKKIEMYHLTVDTNGELKFNGNLSQIVIISDIVSKKDDNKTTENIKKDFEKNEEINNDKTDNKEITENTLKKQKVLETKEKKKVFNYVAIIGIELIALSFIIFLIQKIRK